MPTDPADRGRLAADLYDEQRTGAICAVLFHAAVAARAGLNITDVSCLGVLDKEGPMTAGRLAERVGLTRGGAITAVLDRMERAGLLRRRPDPDDRRRAIIELVRDRPYQAIQDVLEKFSTVFTALIDSYSESEIQVLLDFSRKANGVLREQTRELQARDSV